MASLAAALMFSGALKSGNPCARFTALCSIASRLISRMTDSVKLEVRSLRNRSRESMTICREYSSLLGSVKSAVHIGVAHHDLHVITGLSEGNRFDELRRFLESRILQPVIHAGFARIVGSQRRFPLPTQLVQHHAQIEGAQLQIDI